MAAASGLIYVSDTEPGIRRRRQGRHFAYIDPEGRPITDERERTRINKLAIPPAYRDVWICKHPRGHLQATGRDARGRKQYRYHPQWREVRDGAKFDRMIEFGAALPKLRKRLRSDLSLISLSREKVLALVVKLLDTTGVRIGNREYARDNNSFGLTTLRDRHVRFIDGRAFLRFRGKGGAEHEIVIDDERISSIMRHCQQLPGQQLFQYVDDDGQRRPIDSGQINDYLREAMGADFTAKDFRTWAATVRAIVLMACTPLPEKPTEKALNSHIVAAVKQVAAQLRNTPAVCRKSYINPVVFTAWRSGSLHKAIRVDMARMSNRQAEQFALAFLKREARRAKREARRMNEGLASTLRASIRAVRTARVGTRSRKARPQRPRRASRPVSKPLAAHHNPLSGKDLASRG
jgi:DNA topoisomerase IB